MPYSLTAIAAQAHSDKQTVAKVALRLGIKRLGNEPFDDIDAQRILEYLYTKRGRRVLINAGQGD